MLETFIILSVQIRGKLNWFSLALGLLFLDQVTTFYCYEQSKGIRHATKGDYILLYFRTQETIVE